MLLTALQIHYVSLYIHNPLAESKHAHLRAYGNRVRSPQVGAEVRLEEGIHSCSCSYSGWNLDLEMEKRTEEGQVHPAL